jgi:hypothetical protein
VARPGLKCWRGRARRTFPSLTFPSEGEGTAKCAVLNFYRRAIRTD